MAPGIIPEQAHVLAQNRLKIFRTRVHRLELKTFEAVDASKEAMQNFLMPFRVESQLLSFMERKTRFPCIVCQGEKGVLYCSIAYTSKLSRKERISQIRFCPPFYFILYPNESIFFTTRSVIPQVINEALVHLFGGTELKKIPITGRDFRSLRQLHFNGIHKGLLCRRPVQDDFPLDYGVIRENTTGHDDVIEDEDEPWKRKKNSYYREHFFPETDPTITKFTVSSSSKFAGTRSTRQLHCDLKVTFRTENLLTFFDYSMDKGILKYPLHPFLENVCHLGRTSISIDSQE